MGVQITDLLIRRDIELKQLSNKLIVIDTPMWLYQFLSSIRQSDGTPLQNAKGDVTSHILGLTSRITRLVDHNIKLAFCFDGVFPELKTKERERRNRIKEQSQKEYEIAKEREDITGMKKYASRTSRLTSAMIKDTKELLGACGFPVIQAPMESEAQAAYIVKKGDAYAVGSNDADSFLYGAPRVVRNLSIIAKRKKQGTHSYQTVMPEMIQIQETLASLEITQDQLILLAVLVGTDYNYGGIKGIGPKNALKLVKKYSEKELFQNVKWNEFFEYSYEDVLRTIKEMKTTDDYSLKQEKPDVEEIKTLLSKHDFSSERIDKFCESIVPKQKQKGLSDFF